MYEKLPIENEQIFKEILSITQLLTKYRIKTTKIYFDQDLNIVLYFEKAKVQIGNMNNIEEKMIKLQYIVPQLDGLSGTLYMENYQNDSKEDYITFQRDDVQSHSELNMEEILVSENQVQVSGNELGSVSGNESGIVSGNN
jgi:cell division protein FtsQ